MARKHGKRKSARQLGYAVIGLGHIAQVAVLPAFAHAKNSRLVALVSDDEEKRRKLSRKYRCDAYGYRDLDDVLARPDVDAVYIALPNDMHAEFAVRCAQAGVHVLCEKPLALTEAECRRMIDACQNNGVKLMTAYRLHFDPANLEVVKLIEKGVIGETRMFSSDFSYQVKEGNIRTIAERGGGAIWDIGIYCINAARYCFRADPIEVVAIRADRHSDPRFSQVHEGMSAVMKFPDERLATFNVSFGAATTSRYSVTGTKGDLCLDNAYEYVGERELTITVEEKSRKRTFPSTDQFAPELVAFSDAVLHDRDIEPDGEEGLRDVRVIDAALRSAREGRAIHLTWPPRRRRPEPRDKLVRPRVREPEQVNVTGASG
jgi:glucose-fructose oxidoreductase